MAQRTQKSSLLERGCFLTDYWICIINRIVQTKSCLIRCLFTVKENRGLQKGSNTAVTVKLQKQVIFYQKLKWPKLQVWWPVATTKETKLEPKSS